MNRILYLTLVTAIVFLVTQFANQEAHSTCADEVTIARDATMAAIIYQSQHDLLSNRDKMIDFYYDWKQFSKDNGLYNFKIEWLANDKLGLRLFELLSKNYSHRGALPPLLDELIFTNCGV